MCHPDWELPMDPEVDLPFALSTWVDLAPFETTLGMRIESADGGEATLTMPFTVKLAQGKGLLHGGALTSLADTAAAMAIKTLLPEGTHFATVEMATRFLAPVRQGVVTARARARKDSGRERIYLGEVEVHGVDAVKVAEFTSTFRLARPRQEGSTPG